MFPLAGPSGPLFPRRVSLPQNATSTQRVRETRLRKRLLARVDALLKSTDPRVAEEIICEWEAVVRDDKAL